MTDAPARSRKVGGHLANDRWMKPLAPRETGVIPALATRLSLAAIRLNSEWNGPYQVPFASMGSVAYLPARVACLARTAPRRRLPSPPRRPAGSRQ